MDLKYRRRLGACAFVALMAVGCGGSDSGPGPGVTDTDIPFDTDTSDTDPTDNDPADNDPADNDPADNDPAAICGNGIVEGAEGCDDGNTSNTDACLNTCTVASCGDGYLRDGVETCDDGNTNNDDGCNRYCLPPGCGDREVDLSAGESCDDGGKLSGDGCNAQCHVDSFTTRTPVLVSGDLSCTTAPANRTRKIAVDGSGRVYVVMQCGALAYVAVSRDRGVSFTPPVDISPVFPDSSVSVAQVATMATVSNNAYVVIMLSTGDVYLRSTPDAGVSWSGPVSLGTSSSTNSGLGVDAFNDLVFVSFVVTDGVDLRRNTLAGTGPFETTSVAIGGGGMDVMYDASTGTTALCTDSPPSFRVRLSDDEGATFAMEVNPPGQQYFSDWSAGGGAVFVVGENIGALGNSTKMYRIVQSSPTLSTEISGLPFIATAFARTVAANIRGDAFIATQLASGGVQLDLLPAGLTVFGNARPLGTSSAQAPGVTALPGNSGAAVVYTQGTGVYATIQAY